MATFAPISISASAICRPSPREPPVTSAVRPARSKSFFTPMRRYYPAMATLVMFSGGLDSTAMLVKLLTQTKDELRVHHIRMANKEGREGAEQQAVERIVAYCRRHYRPFRYSESGLDFRTLEAIPIDFISVAYVACQVAIDTPGCNRVAVATLARDTDIVNRSARQREVFHAMYECYRYRRLGEPDVQWIYPVYDLSKPAIAALLPARLANLTWSCRTPVKTRAGYKACGACKACRVRADAALQSAPSRPARTKRAGGARPARGGKP